MTNKKLASPSQKSSPLNLSNIMATLLEKLFLWFVRGFEKIIGRYSIFGDTAFFDAQRFKHLTRLEKNWLTVYEELAALLQSGDVPNIQDISKRQSKLTDDSRWKAYFFYVYGLKINENCERCPKTTELIEQVPGLKTAFFSILSPHKHLDEHRGPYKGIIRCHLALKIPEPRTKCSIRVDTELRHWEEGKNLVFDDSRLHEAWNNTEEDRVVLILDFIRPLSFPFSLINQFVFSLSTLLPDVREVVKKSRIWNKKYQTAQDS